MAKRGFGGMGRNPRQYEQSYEAGSEDAEADGRAAGTASVNGI